MSVVVIIACIALCAAIAAAFGVLVSTYEEARITGIVIYALVLAAVILRHDWRIARERLG